MSTIFELLLALLAMFASHSAAELDCAGRYEDESPMYWNAEQCGNGQGTSFINLNTEMSVSL